MPIVTLLKNMKLKQISILLLMSLSINLYATNLYHIPESEGERLRQDLSNADIQVRKEALIKLQWAGISDERVFDPIVEKLQSNRKMDPKYAKIYLAALIYSGNPKYLTFMDSLIEDNSRRSQIRNFAKKHKHKLEHYQSISKLMNDNNNIVSSEEFWARRYEKGLRVSESVRVRLAARDLYLSGLNESSYDVAKAFLAEKYKTNIDDSYAIDAMAFLCKSLGLSRNTKYKDILVEVSNNTPNRKLAKYAERSAQYFDRGFKSQNAVLKKKKN